MDGLDYIYIYKKLKIIKYIFQNIFLSIIRYCQKMATQSANKSVEKVTTKLNENQVQTQKNTDSAFDIDNLTIERMSQIMYFVLWPTESEIELPASWDDSEDEGNESFIYKQFPEIQMLISGQESEPQLTILFMLSQIMLKYKHDFAPIFEQLFEHASDGFGVSDTINQWIKTVLKIMSTDSRSDTLPPFPIVQWSNDGGFTVYNPPTKTKTKTKSDYNNFNNNQTIYDAELNEYVTINNFDQRQKQNDYSSLL